jgi:hypothetical protein
MDQYSTHTELLKFLMDNLAIETVLELGMGHFSTPLFRSYPGVSLVSLDSDINWVNQFSPGPNHTVGAYPLLGFARNVTWFDLAFVDGNPASERAACVQELLLKTRLVVAHDTGPEDNWNYHYDEIVLPEGFVRLDYTKKSPWTSVFTADAEVIAKVQEFNG